MSDLELEVPDDYAQTDWDDLPPEVQNRIGWAVAFHAAGLPVVPVRAGTKEATAVLTPLASPEVIRRRLSTPTRNTMKPDPTRGVVSALLHHRPITAQSRSLCQCVQQTQDRFLFPPHRPPLPTLQRTDHRPINSNILLKNLIHKVVLLGHSVSSIPCPRKLGPIYGDVVGSFGAGHLTVTLGRVDQGAGLRLPLNGDHAGAPLEGECARTDQRVVERRQDIDQPVVLTDNL